MRKIIAGTIIVGVSLAACGDASSDPQGPSTSTLSSAVTGGPGATTSGDGGSGGAGSEANTTTQSGAGTGGSAPISGYGVMPDGKRDKTKWPFAVDSIWNTPIGENAQYQGADIHISSEPGYPTRFTQDQDVIVMHPEAPLHDIVYNHEAWNNDGQSRCGPEGKILQTVPMPTSLVIPNSGDNNSAAFLDPTGHFVIQNQPFTRCAQGGPATTNYKLADQDIYGDGIVGAHGGSGLSSIGGTIRYGELTGGIIRHALKINLWAHQYSHCCSPIWPAGNVDGYASQPGMYGGTNVNLGPGALLALDPTFDISSLQTVPGKILAHAFQDYGAYFVDDTFWNAWAIETEQGPDGRVVDEFQEQYGTSMSPSTQTPFRDDIDAIYTHLSIITNNAQGNIGGGGTPRAPLAPPIGN